MAVAGGNAFYEKRGRTFEPLPPDSQFRVAAATPEAANPPSMVAAKKEEPVVAPVAVASAVPQPSLPEAETDAVMTASISDAAQPVMAFEQTPQDTSAIGSLIVSQARPMSAY